MRRFFELICAFLWATAVSGDRSTSSVPIFNGVPPINRLDDYALLTIFDHLDLTELINIADTNARYRALITRHVMIPKFRIHEQEIRLESAHLPSNAANVLYIEDCQTISRFLRHFGHLITKLAFQAPQYADAEIAEITQHIIEHCSDTIVELQLTDVGRQLFESPSTTFPKAARVELQFHCTIFSGEYQGLLNIHRIYPNVEHLTLNTATFVPPSIVHNFPKLTSLHLHEVDTTGHDESIFRDLFQLNPQLREINVNRQLSLDTLAMISANTKELHSLAVAYPSNVTLNRTVHFEHVRRFAVHLSGYNVREQFPITFARLDELEMFEERVLAVPIDIIQQHAGLKTLKLPLTRCDLDFLRCVHLFDRLPELTAIQMLWSTDVSRQETLEFIASRRNVVQIDYGMWSAVSQSELVSIIPAEWRVVRAGIAQTLAYEMYEVATRRQNN